MTAKTNTYGQSRQATRQRWERIIAVGTLFLIAFIWILGAVRAEADIFPALEDAMPAADHFERESNGLYAAWGDSAGETLLGYVAIGRASGYGGPLELAVAVDLEGQITGVSVVRHKETPAWFARVLDSDMLDTLTGKSFDDPFKIGGDIDGVTGATYSVRALAEAALVGSHTAAEVLGLDVPPRESPKIQFGIPEITVLALFVVGYIGHQRNFRWKKQAQWGSMLTGLIVLGFLFNLPLTMAYFSKFILGYWPQWQTNLYWYFLIGGILFVVTADNKNPYCEWFCPFGAAQECMGAIGGARLYPMRRYSHWIQWGQRGLALAAILLGVFFRNPGLSSFEIFGTLFGFVGSSIQFVILAMVLIVALFVKRPWCNYLCPIHSVVELIRVFRKWTKELWQKINQKIKPA